MAMNLLDGIGWVQQQGEMGRQQGVRSRVAELASQTYTATPEQRPSLLGQMAALSPESAAATEQQFVQRDEQAASAEDRRNKLLVSRAGLMVALPVEQRAAMWPSIRQDLMRSDPALSALPEMYDDATFAPVLQQLAGAPEGRDGKVVGNSLVDPQTGRVIYQGPEVPVNAVVVEVADGRGGKQQVMLDPRTRQTFEIPRPSSLGGGSPQGTLPAGSGQPIGGAVVDGSTGQADPAIAALAPDQQQIAFRFMAMGRPFHLKDGVVVEGESAGLRPPGQAATNAEAPATDAGGGWGYTPPGAGAEESYGQPQAVTGPDGRVIYVQFGNRGGSRIVPDYTPAPTDRDNKPPAEGERAAAGYLGRMRAAEALLGGISSEGYTPTTSDYYTAGRGPILNQLAGDQAQRWRQAQEDWVRAKLRKESGAAIPADEMDREISMYFPMPGDSQGVMNQKAASRKQAEAQMLSMAGRAQPVDQVAPPPSAAPTGQYQPGQVIEVNGRRYRVIGGDPNDPDVEEI